MQAMPSPHWLIWLMCEVGEGMTAVGGYRHGRTLALDSRSVERYKGVDR